ncbi:hypothetical protein L1887_51534 [Cichorium endivia]|nr:hypothetical protein L1887_51534 [Cichorium endivia]
MVPSSYVSGGSRMPHRLAAIDSYSTTSRRAQHDHVRGELGFGRFGRLGHRRSARDSRCSGRCEQRHVEALAVFEDGPADVVRHHLADVHVDVDADGARLRVRLRAQHLLGDLARLRSDLVGAHERQLLSHRLAQLLLGRAQGRRWVGRHRFNAPFFQRGPDPDAIESRASLVSRFGAFDASVPTASLSAVTDHLSTSRFGAGAFSSSSSSITVTTTSPARLLSMPGVNSIKLLTGNSHPELAQLVADRLGIPLTPCVCKKFADQSIDVRIGSSVRDEDVYVLQTGNSPYTDPNDSLMELLIILSACKTASARRITAVIPSFPYSRHDKKDKSRAPITAKLVANMLTVAGDHVITMDLHASQIQGFFDIPVDNLTSEPSVARWIRTKVDNCATPSSSQQRQRCGGGGDGQAQRTERVGGIAGLGHLLVALVQARVQRCGQRHQVRRDGRVDHDRRAGSPRPQRRSKKNLAESGTENDDDSEDDENTSRMEILVGDVKGKVAILVDDMVDTGRTLALAAKTLEAAGADKVYAIITHGLLSGQSIELVKKLSLERLVVTNTIPNTEKAAASNGKLEIMDVSAVIGETIRRSHHGESISQLSAKTPRSCSRLAPLPLICLAVRTANWLKSAFCISPSCPSHLASRPGECANRMKRCHCEK